MAVRTFKLAGGEVVRIQGAVHAEWEDNHYERLKARMKAAGNHPSEPLVEHGRVHAILQDQQGAWYWARTPVESEGLPTGECRHELRGASMLERFDGEGLLLQAMKARLRPDDEFCPVRNLLGEWERFDVLNLWLQEAE